MLKHKTKKNKKHNSKQTQMKWNETLRISRTTLSSKEISQIILLMLTSEILQNLKIMPRII